MSLYKDASLVMIPSAYKDGKLYSIRPTDGSGDFTFSRGSNLAATRVDVNGLIEKGRENLFTYSNDFSNANWTKYNGVTLSSGESGYDGSNDAWLLTKPATTFTGVGQNILSANGVITFSVYMKAGTHSIATIRLIGIPDRNVVFNLSNGTFFGGSSTGWIDRKIESVGGGWYKCSFTLSNTGSTLAVIYPDEITNGTGGTIYIQDAQFEQGLVATDYIETGTSAAQSGILEDMPRLDYSGSASCPSLLLEPQRTNLISQSEYFDAWTKEDISITSNVAISPQGLQNASKLTPNTNNTDHTIYQGISASGDRSFSVFAKAAGYDFVFVGDNNNNVNDGAIFNLAEGTIALNTSGYNASIEDFGNGWYRCSIYGNFSSVYSCICPAEDGTTFDFAGDGTSGIYVYGGQWEVGSYPTSYIPTYGSSVTRSKDGGNFQIDGLKTNGYFGDTYTLFFEFNELDFGSAAPQFNYLYDDDNNLPMYVYGTTLTISTEGGPQYSNFISGFANPRSGKFLVKYSGSEIKIFKDGSLYLTYSNPSNQWSKPKFLRLHTSSATASISYKQVLTFPTALTDSECIALTTL